MGHPQHLATGGHTHMKPPHLPPAPAMGAGLAAYMLEDVTVHETRMGPAFGAGEGLL